MSSDPMKVGDIHKPDIHGDSLPWETRLVNETNTAFSSMDYGPNNWETRKRKIREREEPGLGWRKHERRVLVGTDGKRALKKRAESKIGVERR
ncbi:uncharacterized protein TNCV_2260401 [Trichonephila clavipes]|nr:uncharacterized protein TNCV_2260401 [Trichonephila clavipes]